MKTKHVADDLRKKKKIVYPAFSKSNYYYREHISKFVLGKKAVPLNPFMIFNYYLLDTVSRDRVREANNNLIRLADELWVFGEVSDGVASEIRYAKKLDQKIRYFAIKGSPQRIVETKEAKVMLEKGVAKKDLV